MAYNVLDELTITELIEIHKDMDTALGQVASLQEMTGSPELDDALYSYSHDGKSVMVIIDVLDNFKNISVLPDDVVTKLTNELATRLREEHDRGSIR